MQIRVSALLIVACTATIVGWMRFAASPAVSAVKPITGHVADSDVYYIDLFEDGFTPDHLEVNLGSIPTGVDPTIKISFANHQARRVRLFGNSSSCNQFGCSRTRFDQDWIEPGAVAQVRIDPMFKSGSTLGAEVVIYAGSDQLFEWKIKIRGKRTSVAK